MDISSLSKTITHSLSDGVFGNLFTNPIYVSLLITTIIVLIVVCMYNESKLIKTSFYIFCTCMLVIFIHNKLLMIEHKKQLSSSDADSILNSIDQNITGRYETNTTKEETLGYLSM